MDQETITVGVTSGVLGFLSPIILSFIKSKMTQKVDIGPQPPTRLEPNPLSVKLIEEFVTKEEFRAAKDKNREQHIELFARASDFVPKKDFEAHAQEDRADHAELFQTLRTHESKDADNRAGIANQLGQIDGKLELIIKHIGGRT
jgi:hypothetical protein